VQGSARAACATRSVAPGHREQAARQQRRPSTACKPARVTRLRNRHVAQEGKRKVKSFRQARRRRRHARGAALLAASATRRHPRTARQEEQALEQAAAKLL